MDSKTKVLITFNGLMREQENLIINHPYLFEPNDTFEFDVIFSTWDNQPILDFDRLNILTKIKKSRSEFYEHILNLDNFYQFENYLRITKDLLNLPLHSKFDRLLSQFYCFSNSLDYIIENNKKYDLVVKARTDSIVASNVFNLQTKQMPWLRELYEVHFGTLPQSVPKTNNWYTQSVKDKNIPFCLTKLLWNFQTIGMCSDTFLVFSKNFFDNSNRFLNTIMDIYFEMSLQNKIKVEGESIWYQFITNKGFLINSQDYPKITEEFKHKKKSQKII